MRLFSSRLLSCLLLGGLVALSGCWSSSSVEEVEFTLGDMIESFDPPTPAELDGQVEWVEKPVESGLERMREYLAEQPELATLDEARDLRNTSDEANEKIRKAYATLPSSSDEVDWNGEMIRYAKADVRSINPLMGDSVVEFDVTAMMSVGLLTFDWELRPFAMEETVRSWHTSKDSLYEKFVLRDDLTWSDGRPITAHDFEFTYKVIMSEKVPIPAVRTGTDQLKYVKAYDDHTLVFFHKQPQAINVWNIQFPIIPKHIYEKSIYEDPTLKNSPYHVELESKPVTGGPYVVSHRELDGEIVLERREGWYMHDGEQVRARPYFRRVVFKVIKEPSVALAALKAGDLHEKELTPEEWQTKTAGDDFYERSTKARATQWTTFFFAWNLDLPYFDDLRVRQALAYAFDYDELMETLLYGLEERARGNFHPDSPWFPEDAAPLYERDIAKARKLLDAAGWIDRDGDGVRDKEIDGRLEPFKFSVLTPSIPERIAICALLKESLSQVNIEVDIRAVDFTVYQQKSQDHEFQALFGGWGSGAYPDTNENLWMTDKDRNFVHYSNPRVDELFVQARTELDHEKRREIFGEIHKLLFEDQPYMWLFNQSAKYGFNKDRVGWYFSPRGPFTYSPGFESIWLPERY